ncbi:ATP-binding protein [Azonexus sp. R2A61]|uniref:cache domain-containing sensor histidine kinase n=1 Tax=Azonexus sp. R2A61 TaxID=2744443 RepID=UPI001F45DA1B|nr:ATP-binding protein [Azonexus sp. R2A61]
MRHRRPETLALIVALSSTLAVLTVFLIDLALSRQRDLQLGEKRLQQFTVMLAEHTARAFEAVDVLVREIATDLSTNRTNWPRWEPALGWDYIAQRHSRAMPQMRDLIVFDRIGEQRFISTYFPPPRINIAQYPFFRELAGGKPSITYGPYIGPNSGRYTYGIAHRIEDGERQFAGIAFAAIETGYMQDFCWANRLADEFDAMLTNVSGSIIASCRPADLSQQSTILGRPVGEVLFGSAATEIQLPETGLLRLHDKLVSVSPVPGFPDLRLIAAMPQNTVLSNWWSRLKELGTLGILLSAVLLTGGVLVRRQVRELAEVTDALAHSHDRLEAKVQEATAELAEQKESAELANAAKSRFLAAASHDLRQPMHALALFSTDLRRRAGVGNLDDLPRLAEQIAVSTGLLGEMLDALLDISRLDINGIKADIHPFPLANLYERLEAAFRRSAADRNINLRFHPTRHILRSDPMLLERMLGNLIANAIRYTPPGGRVIVGARRHGRQVRLEVRDSGIGIAREHQASIFAEFYQVSNSAREQGSGLGLGLSIVDRLARALSVEILLKSRIGEGTTFGLVVPQAERDAIVRPSTVGRVHLIGDTPELATCRPLLEGWNYEVSSGGIESAQRLRGDTVIICDAGHIPDLAPAMRLIVLVAGEAPLLPPRAQALSLPVKPARLRALLRAG